MIKKEKRGWLIFERRRNVLDTQVNSVRGLVAGTEQRNLERQESGTGSSSVRHTHLPPSLATLHVRGAGELVSPSPTPTLTREGR